MKMKLSDVRVRYQNLWELSKKKLPHKLAYAIAKNILKLEAEGKLIEERRMDIIHTYAKKDEDGKLITNGINYELGDNAEIFNKEFNDFLETETVVDIHTVNSQILEISEDPRYDVLTVTELIALDFMLVSADCTGATDEK